MAEGDDELTGVVLRCAPDGTVLDVLRDDPVTELVAGRLLSEVLDPGSVEDGLWLVTEAASDRAGGVWGLTVLTPTGVRWPLLFVGCPDLDGPDDGALILVGASGEDELLARVEGIGATHPEVAGRLRHLATSRPGAVDDQEVIRALSAANNELVTMHRELARTGAELEQLNRRKDEILARVAHDLRNPLSSIAGFGELLERQLGDVLDEQARLMLQRIGRLSQRMLLLVEDLLDVSVLEGGMVRLDVAEHDLADLVVEAVEMHRYAAEQKDVTVQPPVADRPLVARVDRDRLHQVVDNLLSNAVKFSPDRAGATVTVACTRDGDEARITVRDEGAGIPDEEQSRLFEPFGRASTRGTGHERSTGLGLAICRSIVDGHGGTIRVDSQVGQGSTFEVRLPIAGPPGAEGPTA